MSARAGIIPGAEVRALFARIRDWTRNPWVQAGKISDTADMLNPQMNPQIAN
jgi:hypothetical protein